MTAPGWADSLPIIRDVVSIVGYGGTVGSQETLTENLHVDPERVLSLQRISRRIGAGCIALGVLVLLGWALDLRTLTAFHPSFVTMKPNTAVGIALSGLALAISRASSPTRWQRASRVLGPIVATLGALTLAEYIGGWNFGFDDWIFHDRLAATASPFPGRMSAATAFNFLALGLAVMIGCSDQRRLAISVAQGLALIVTFSALVTVLGYTYNVRSLYAISPFSTVAVHTALAFFAVGIAVLFRHPDCGWLRPLVSRSPGGTLSRVLLPAALVTPTAIGWFCLKGHELGYYDLQFGLALAATSSIACFAGFVGWTALAITAASTETARAERAELQSRSRFNALSESGIIGIVVGTLDSRIVDINDALLKMIGYGRDEILSGKVPWPSLTPELWRDTDNNALSTLRGSGEVAMREKEYIRKDGSLVPVAVGTTLIAGSDAEAISFVLDLTTNREAALAIEHLREAKLSEAKFRGLLEAAPDSVVIVNSEGQIVFANAQTERMFGYHQSELVGASVDTLLPVAMRESHRSHRTVYFENLTARPMGAGLELFARRKDGCEFPVEISLSPLVTEHGVLVTSSIRDITERRKFEEQQAQLAAIVSSSEDAIIGETLDGVITSWNNGAERLFGYTAQEVIGQSISLLAPAERGKEQPAVLKRVADGEHVQHFETLRRAKNGQILHVSVSTFSVRNGHGKTLGASKIVRDMTARQLAEKALAQAKDAAEAANRELEAFSYSVAHDLRAPLRGMAGFAEVLRNQYHDKLDAEGQDWLQEIVDNAQKMAELIDALLSLARMSRSDLKQQDLDLTKLAREVAAEISTQDPQRSVQWSIAETLRVNADQRLVRALLENLFGNAWKFTAKVALAKIELGVTNEGGCLVYFIRDNGAGFDMTYASKLFAPFQRLHTVAEFTGTGIGLATVQRIVHRHGGRVWAKGAVNQGATIYFTLPPAHATETANGTSYTFG